MTDRKRLVIDADSHKCENPLVFLDHIERPFRDRLGFFRDRYGEQRFRILDRDPQTGARDFARPFLQPDGLGKGTYRPYHAETTIGGLFNRVRLEHMDREGIDAQLIYGSIPLAFASIIDAELAVALCRAYNDYIAADCAPHATRLHPVAVLPLQDPVAAVAELRRCVEDLGMPAVTLAPHLPVPHPDAPDRFPALRVPRHLSHPDFHPILAEAERLDVAIGIHGAPGVYLAAGAADQLDSFTLVHVFANRALQQTALAKLIFDGTLERFPRLRFGFLEAGCGWLPDLMHSLREHWEKRVVNLDPGLEPSVKEFLGELLRERREGFGLASKAKRLLGMLFTPAEKEVTSEERQRFLYEHPDLPRDPFAYLERGQIFLSFEPDDPAPTYLPHALGEIGRRVACMAVDYGHWDATLRGCVGLVTDRDGIDAAHARRLVGENALELYGPRLRSRLAPDLRPPEPTPRIARGTGPPERFDPFQALPQAERAQEMARVRRALCDRDGEPDIAAQRLPRRERRLDRIRQAPQQWRGPRSASIDDWLAAVVKVNEGEEYGARREMRRVLQRGTVRSEQTELHILLEEQVHSRILAEVCRSCGVPFEPRPPPRLMRWLIHGMQRLPGSIRYVPILCGEALGCVVFAALRDATDRFESQPVIARRLRGLLDEIVADETLHTLYCRARLGPGAMRVARWLAPLVAASFVRDVPELRAIGCDEQHLVRSLRRGLVLSPSAGEIEEEDAA